MKTHNFKRPFLYFVLSLSCLLFTDGCSCEPEFIPSFSVTFDTDGGSIVTAQIILRGGKVTNPPTPTREGYTFVGWYRDSEKRISFNFASETISAPITIYAKWDQDAASSFTVTFNTGGGSSVAEVKVESGDKVTKPTDPTRVGYTFEGWYKDNLKKIEFNFDVETITATATIFAKWKIHTYTFTFDMDGGTPSIDAQTVNHGDKANEPNEPSKTGKIFVGWYKDNLKKVAFDFDTETITAATTVFAKWRLPNEEARIVSFSFVNTTNEGLLDVSNADIIGTIDEGAKTVSFTDVSPYVQLNKLKASFTVSSGATLNIGSENQSTGETVNDFSSPITYEVVAEDGVTKQSYAVTITISNLATIPDANFRGKLQAQFPNAFMGDLLDITHSDVTGFNGAIDVRTSSIASLKGIEFFTAITQLWCNDNELNSLDVSKNTQLTRLECNDNELGSLDVRTNTQLIQLDCSNNQLLSLDVSKNTQLKSLFCHTNQLSSLDVRTNTLLENLSCRTNQLSALNVRTNINLITLSCTHNQLGALNVRNNTQLTTLECNNNKIGILNLRTNTQLTQLWCYDNQLTSLDMRGLRSTIFSGLTTADGANAYTSLSLHENLKDAEVIKGLKRAFPAAIISTYSAAAGSTIYTLVCNDYNPNEAEGSRCKD